MSEIHFHKTTTLSPEQFVMGTVAKGVLGKAFANSITAIEARNYGAPTR
jgi:hypothetical protein